MKLRSLVCVLAVGIGSLLYAPQAESATLLDDEEYKLTLGGSVSGVWGAEFPQDGPTMYGPILSLARLKTQATWKDLAYMKIQMGGASGTARVLDAEATLTALDPVHVRLGQFKTPISREYQVGAPATNFVNRADLVRYVPRRRLGAELRGNFEVGSVEIQPHLGAFQPNRANFTDPDGQLMTSRVLVDLPSDMDAHVAYSDYFAPDNRLSETPEAGETRTLRREDFDSVLDAAFVYNPDDMNVHVEGLSVLDPPGNEPVFGGYGHVLFHAADFDGLVLEPGARYDLTSGPGTDELGHSAYAGLNTYWWNSKIFTLVNYVYQNRPQAGGDRRESHGVYFEMQIEM